MKNRTFLIAGILSLLLVIFSAGAVSADTVSDGEIAERQGIDVSAFQGAINWQEVRADGIDFAFIRAGGSYGSNGKIYDDDRFRDNMENAIANGIDTGVYFFSQAVTPEEAVKEAEYTCRKLAGYEIKLPVVIDVECPEGCRQSGITVEQRTAVIKAFCGEVKKQGYEPMIYSGLDLLESRIDMEKLAGYKVWVAQYYKECRYQNDYVCWQYTDEGKVRGIDGYVDRNIWYSPGIERIDSVKLSSAFKKVNDTVYKYRTRGKQVNAIPSVKNRSGEILEKDRDYAVSYSHKTRVNPGRYTITVKGKGRYTGTMEIRLVITPPAVTGINARLSTGTGGYDDAYVTWNRSSGASGYQVYARRPSKTDKWTCLGRTTKTSFLEKNLYDGSEYEFRVFPYIFRDDVRYCTTENYTAAHLITLKKAYRPSVRKYNSGRVKISWKDISGESGYQVKASRKGKTSYFRTSANTMSLSVAKDRKYTYRIRAYKNVKKGSESHRVYGPWSDADTYILK